MDDNIAPLYERPDLIPDAAALMGQIWPNHYGPDGPGDAQADLYERCRAKGLPFGIVASRGDKVVGLGALDAASCGSNSVEVPWLVGLCVAPMYRGQGIASQIAQAAMTQASVQGYDAIFATTQTAVGLLTRAGWQDLRDWNDTAGAWRILKAAI